jgi:hypothetical protein
LKIKLKPKPKHIYCATLGHAVEYPVLLEEAKRISAELHRAKEEGFLKSADGDDAMKLASVLACFKGTIEEVHVPLKEEGKASQWARIRSVLA